MTVIKGNRWEFYGRLAANLILIGAMVATFIGVKDLGILVRFLVGLLLTVAILLVVYGIYNDLRRQYVTISFEETQMVVKQFPWPPCMVEWDEVAMVLLALDKTDLHINRIKVYWNDDWEPDQDFLLPTLDTLQEKHLRTALEHANGKYHFDLQEVHDAQMPDAVL